MIELCRILQRDVTRREADLRFGQAFVACAALAVLAAGLRVLFRMPLTDIQLVFGLLLVLSTSSILATLAVVLRGAPGLAHCVAAGASHSMPWSTAESRSNER